MPDSNNSMGLIRWTDGTDKFDYSALAANFLKIAEHNHESGNGVQIGTKGILPGAIGSSQLAYGSVTANHIAAGAISTTQLANKSITKGQIDYTSFDLTTSLPSTTGLDTGYTVLYTDDTESPNYIWQLRWSGSVWHFIGGSSIIKESQSSLQLDSISYTLLSGTTVSSLPAGKYEITFGGTLNIYVASGQSTALAYLGIGSSSSIGMNSEIVYSAPNLASPTNTGVSLSRTITKTLSTTTDLDLYGLASGTGLSLNGNTEVTRRFISIKPIYLS